MKSKDEVVKFSREIEEISRTHKMGIMDSIIFYCEKSGLEVEIAAKLISPPLKSKIRSEAEDLHMLKKSARLF